MKNKANKPNIIFLMDDQHRHDAFGFIDGVTKTPTIDRLSAQGVHFSQAACQAPMCIPSRNSMMFGLYPNQIDVLRNRKGIPDDKLPNLPLAEQFRAAGYETAGFGKTHWEIECDTRGFETRYIGECREIGAVMMADQAPELKQQYSEETADYGAGEENNNGYIGRTSGLDEKCHRDGWVTRQCLDYLDRREDDRPLFLYLSYLKPHAGHNVPAGYEGLYDEDDIVIPEQPPWTHEESLHAAGNNRNELYIPFWSEASVDQWKKMALRYKANCTWIDTMFGRVMKRLEDSGLLENALIIYLSDHGEMLGERYYRFNKYCLYESSVRVPMILSGSALPEAYRGVTDERNVELTDMYTTLLRFSGIEVPERCVGFDLLDSGWERSGSFSALHEREGEASFMWRDKEYKLIMTFRRERDITSYVRGKIIGGEFYDLKADPQEWNDLYEEPEQQMRIARMAEDLIDHMKDLSIYYQKESRDE
ncbi:MAG: sulfatase-like hydrolase/transferase [Spirochaetia bacterium]|nr:sulfatase-like hydrolase/transferase [Spirochaetia bacterium]